MAMSPEEAASITFEESRRGYDTLEVEAFRQRVAEALHHYTAELAKATAQLQTLEAKTRELEEAEEAVKRTFVAATRTKAEMTAEAERDAEQLRSTAHEEAERVKSAAAREAAQVKAEAKAEAARLTEETEARVSEREEESRLELRQLESRVARMRTAVRELEQRLRAFADDALGELAVAADLIDLETTDLEDIESLQMAGAITEGDDPSEVAGEETVAQESTEPVASEQVELLDEPVPVTEPVAIAAEPGEGPAMTAIAPGAPARRVPSSSESADEEGFYQRRLAGLRRRLEDAEGEAE